MRQIAVIERLYNVANDAGRQSTRPIFFIGVGRYYNGGNDVARVDQTFVSSSPVIPGIRISVIKQDVL